MNKYVETIIELSEKALLNDDVPVGAIVVYNDKIIGKGYNKKNLTKKVTDHAEIIAINEASKYLNDWRLDNCALYVTLEPCNMCKEVIKQARIKDIYYLLPSNFYNEKQRKINMKLIDINDKNIIGKYRQKLTNFFESKR